MPLRRHDGAHWRNVSAGVCSYTIGGYQVMKKWLSYRERSLLERDLSKDEAREVMNMARRIAAILLLGRHRKPTRVPPHTGLHLPL